MVAFFTIMIFYWLGTSTADMAAEPVKPINLAP